MGVFSVDFVYHFVHHHSFINLTYIIRDFEPNVKRFLEKKVQKKVLEKQGLIIFLKKC